MAARHKWTLAENVKVMECFYKSSPTRRGYRKRMYDWWQRECPGFVLTEQRLLDQKRTIVTRQLLTSIELEHIQSRVRNTVGVLYSLEDIPSCGLMGDCEEHVNCDTQVLGDSDDADNTDIVFNDLSLEEEIFLSEIKESLLILKNDQN